MRIKSVVVSAALALCAAHSFAQTHTVTFRRLNGTVLSKVEVAHGANATALAPALPVEADMTARTWDCADRLASVTNDVTCWALYEATTAKSPSTSIASQSVASRETPYSLEEYFRMYDNLAWSDEFSGSSLDVGTSSGWWGGTTGGNWQNDTEQGSLDLAEYTTGNNHSISNGILKLNCRRESATRITSARINSKNKVAFKKGRCEIRAKISKQVGTTPAFWTMGTNAGWPWGGEIDVMEQVNGSEWIQTTLHMARYAQNTHNNAHESGSGLVGHEDGVHWGDGFHRMGIVVNERELVWYVDDHICQRMDIRDAKYDVLRSASQYILLNLNFGGSWAGQTNHNNSAIANFQSDDFEIDYCRIFTNTNDNNTIVRAPEPEGARLSGPVKATVWRGWQMKWGKSGAGYYQDHLIGSESVHIRTAVREYCGRDNPDIVTFFTRPQENTGGSNLAAPLYVPGYTTINLSPNSGRNWTDWDGDIREKLRSTVLFNKERFSQEDSTVSNLEISNDYSFTNGCAVVAELVEKDTGAKVKVVGAFVSTTNGVGTAGSAAVQGFDTLISKINAMKDEKVILLLQGEGWANWNYLDNRVKTELKPSFTRLGQFTTFWPAYQSAWVTESYQASAENPAPLSVPKSNGQPSGVHTNQAYCATVQFEAPPAVEYGLLATNQYAKSMNVIFAGVQDGAELTNFPVLVRLSTAIDGFSYSDFSKADGGDLRFADDSGTLLPHEIDTWNTAGESTVWVKVPLLRKKSYITAHYGFTGTGDPAPVDPKDVWDENYVGVWHLGESALPLKESSETSSDFRTSTGSGIGYASAGIVGKSVDFGESGNSRSVIAPDHDALDGFTACTFEAWTYMDAAARSFKKDGTDAAKGLLTKRTGYGNQASYHMWDTGSGTSVCVSSNSTSHTQIAGIANVPSGEWVHQVVAFNAGSTANYKGGAAAGTGTTPVKKINTGDANLHLGNFQAGDTRNFPGKIDEVRISKTARSAAWVKATYDTIANAGFATYAIGEDVPPEPPAPRIAFASDTPGFDWTNRVVTVTNAASGAALTLTATAADGTTTTATATADANGEASFSVATAPATEYSYTVSQGGSEVAAGGFFTGGWNAGGTWFSASAASG
ncbi:MAG: DUF2341 domain-containing protein, partial [Kiritimatiellae bacterium]|nr:DUF2341 domain-containing protein [Kiritimatiellia bacterium]